MKKLFYILLFTTLTFGAYSCGSDHENEPPLEFDDWNDKRSPNYKPEGYNPLEGEWLEQGSPKPTFKIIFTKDFEELYSYLENSGNWGTNHTLGTYKINDREFKRDDKDVIKWSISQNGKRKILILTLGDSVGKYYRE